MGKFNFIIILLLLSAVISAQSQVTSNEGVVGVKMASVYDKPDKKSKKLRSLSQNIQVKILKTQGDWYYIEAQEKEGWTEKSNIKLIIRTEESQTKNSEAPIKEKPVEQKKPERIKNEPPPTVPITKPKEENRTYLGQTHLFSPYMFGIKAGINIAKIDGNDVPSNADSRMGLTAGGFFVYRFGKGFGLQGEILYNQKGYVQGDSTSKIDYVSVPILIRYTLESGKLNPFINAGIELSYNTNKGLVTPDETYVYDDIKEFDSGLAFGGGIEYDLTGISYLILDIRYVMGLSTFHDKSVHDVEELDIKNNVLSITLGYTF
ncbi:MAG: porin family protein [bacterium]